MKEATQRCRDLGLNYEVVQTQVADEFGLFKAVVKIIDKSNNRYAEWPTARLSVWLDLIRNNSDITAENAFYSIDINWLEREDEVELNESLNSSRISLNLSAMKDALLGKPMKSCFKTLRSKFSPWSDKKQSNTNSPKQNEQIKKKLSFDENDDINECDNKISDKTSTSTPNDKTFEEKAQHYLRDLRKVTLGMKKLFHEEQNKENIRLNEQRPTETVLKSLEQIEQITNDIRHLLKSTENETELCKTPKSVRFKFD